MRTQLLLAPSSVPSVRRAMLVLVFGVLLFCTASSLVAQASTGPLRGPGVAPSGSTIDLEVGSNADHVDVSIGGPVIVTVPVGPDRRARVPVLPLPAGTILFVSIGRGLLRHVLLVEIVDA